MAMLASASAPNYKADMTRKRAPKVTPLEEPPPTRGRPPLPPRTKFARVIRDLGKTVKSVADEMPGWAVKVGLKKSAAPQAKTLLDAVNGRHWPSAPVMLIIREMTASWGHRVDLQDWVADLYQAP